MVRIVLALAFMAALFLAAPAQACDASCALGVQQVYAAPFVQSYVAPVVVPQVQHYVAPLAVQSYAVPVRQRFVVQRQVAPVVRQRVRIIDRVRIAPQVQRQRIVTRGAVAVDVGY